MDWLDAIPANLQGYATAIFVIAMAVLAAYFNRRGANEKDKVHEFSVAGQLADMGPVKELVEGVGLLIQQQVRTNIALERTGLGLEAIADRVEKLIGLYEGQILIARDEHIAEEVARQLQQAHVPRRPRARRTPRSP